MPFGKRRMSPAGPVLPGLDAFAVEPPPPTADETPPRREGWGSRLFVAALLLYATAMGGGALRDGWRLHVLATSGAPAQAMVLSRAAVRRKYGHIDHKLTFRFTAADGRVVDATGECGPDDYAAAPVGAVVPVLYAPGDPTDAQPDFHGELRGGADPGMAQVRLVLTVFAAGGLGAGVFQLSRLRFGGRRS